MNILDIAKRVLELASKATAEKWERLAGFSRGTTIQSDNGRIVGSMDSECLDIQQERDNASFAAAMRTDAPALASAVLELTAENERLIELLLPLSMIGFNVHASWPDSTYVAKQWATGFGEITVGHCRAAARAVKAFEKGMVTSPRPAWIDAAAFSIVGNAGPESEVEMAAQEIERHWRGSKEQK